MDLNLITFVILAFSSYRITRIFVIDTIFEGFRGKFHTFLLNLAQKQGKLKFFWAKLLDLTSCTFCVGLWISLILYSVFVLQNPLDFGRVDWINVFAIAGVQSLLHTWEQE